ncbi:unnamed protein product [Parnassius apollo]|uniref:(apollo) hypothetical protein n=1 Tax=Parnassius apollo TaxID=110799 RepID=A0A8S3Y9H7_PARAO|nr:unnamed protein product [Parnassius apollo]
MDISKLLKSVNNLNEYISASQDVETNYKYTKIQLNMSTVLALRKAGSLEIEYFNKCEENGAAVKIFGQLLLLPPSKTWSLLGRELISLLKYWLDALRKHIIFHNNHWWLFLQKLLQFIKSLGRRDNWLDINSETKCISMILDSKLLEMLGSGFNPTFCETLVLTEDNTREVKLCRELMDIFITVTTSEPPQLIPSSTSITGKGSMDVKIVISSNSDMMRVDKALRGIFADKYQVLFDVESTINLSSHEKSNSSECGNDSLHEKLAALPRYNYDKEPVSLCARPQLSSVTEVSEVDDHQNLNTSSQLSRYGICQKSLLKGEAKGRENDKTNEVQKTRLSPAATDEKNSVSCLLVASIGTADESVINDTLERLSKNKDYNDDILIDVLVQEALQSKIINHSESKALDAQRDFIKVKENKEMSTTGDKVKNCTVISNSTSAEESNNDMVEGTQFSNINFERRKFRRKNAQSTNIKTDKEISAVKTVDEKTVEEFFSQHFAENRNGELAQQVSPTLAKKINDTSSEGSEGFDDCCIEKDMITNRQLMPDLEVVECLNFMIDEICNEFDKCTENLNPNLEITYEENRLNNPDASNSQKDDLGYSTSKEKNTKSEKGIKLKYKATKTATRPSRRKNKLGVEEQSNEISIIDRDKNAVTEYNENFFGPNNKTNIKLKELTDNKTNTPLIRRKRKLYSPKDEKCNENWNSDCENVSKAVSNEKLTQSKSKITCYKEIENERIEYKRKLRNRKSKQLVLSPKTKKINDAFDKLKNDNNSNEKLILVEKTNNVSVYNFTSDSEDDDFRLSTVKRNNITSGGNVVSSIKDKNKKKANVKRKLNNRPKSDSKFKKSADQLIDERVRELAVDVLNTSLEIQKPLESKVNMEPAPKLAMEHKMEGITDDKVKITEKFESNSVKKKQKRNGKALSLNKEKHNSKEVKTLSECEKTTLSNDTTDRTESPLPLLVVEKMIPPREDIANDSLTTNVIQKFKKIYEERLDTIGCDLNTTQNLLSDVDKNDDDNELNSSSHMYNITEELNQISKCLAPTSKSSPLEEKQSLIKETKKSMKNDKSNKCVFQKELNKKLSTGSKQNKINSNDEIINISGNTEIYLEKSIDTVGSSPITAHGNLDLCKDDLPPSRELLKTEIQPRNLEIDDLNKSLRDFFVKLNREIIEESRNMDENPNSKFRESSPINYEDKVVTKELPVDTNGDIARIVMSPLVSVGRLPSEEIIKWLPSLPNSDSASSLDSNYLKKKFERCVSNQTVDGTKKRNISVAKTKKSTESTEKKYFRYSQISPIKLFDDIKPIAKQNSVASESNEYVKHIKNLFCDNKHVSSTIDMQNQPKTGNYCLRSLTAVHKRESSQDSKMSKSTKIDPSKASETTACKSKSTKSVIECVENPLENNKYWLRSSSAIHDIESCQDSNMSMTTKINASRVSEKTPVKRKSTATSQESKKQKVEVNDTQKICDSYPSISSVNDWLKRPVPTTSRAESLDFGFKENIVNVIEKLDTTLVEIHHNTNKKFINLFVESQKQLNQLKDQRRTQCKQVAAGLLRDIVKLIDVKFSEMDRRSQEMDEQFMEDLKERARRLIQDDCRQKRAMVTLLREDVQAVLDFVNKDKTKDMLQK